MTALQWALLILSLIIVFALVALSRRERAPKDADSEPAPPPSPASGGDQMDIFGRPANDTAPAGPAIGPAFDDFGVGKARRRKAPTVDEARPSRPLVPSAAPTLEPCVPAASEPQARPAAPRSTPAFLRAPSPETRPAPEPPPVSPVPEKIVTLLIAEREGNPILGPKIHTALKAQGLIYGARQVYYRMRGEKTVFAVASLVKPGVLIPEEAAGFSAPGLSMFMVLPGPVQPEVALQDMMSTAQALARSFNAEVYDGRKMILDAEAMRALQADVEAWSKGR